MANHLIARNWPAGSRVVILSKNCAWWIMADLAVWMAGHVSVPIYPSLTAQSVRQLFAHCEPLACFLGERDSSDAAAQAIPAELHVVRFPNAGASNGMAWEEIIRNTPPLPASPQRKPDDIATIIYTSGTTGSPKGAMHRFLAFPAIAGAVAQVTGEGRQRALSYLPLAHIAERGLTETMAIYYSWHVFFGEGAATFLTDLKRARATVFFSVPRLYTKFQQKVFDTVPRHTLARLQRIPVVAGLTGKYIVRSMGLGQVQFAASGSAPLPGELLEWFRSLGLPLTEGYGTTETGITHTAANGECRTGYVGRTAPGVETKISETGEVLLRSAMNMLGYYKNPEDTRQAFTEDGFIRTGDLGELSADGWLRITGRIKEQFKTAKGKYVSPSKIEALLSAHPGVDHCLVLGTNLAAPCAVVVITQSAVLQAGNDAGMINLEKSFEDLLESVNSQVENHERLSFIAMVNTHWTIDNGFLTPTLKLRRAPLEAFYGELIAGWVERGVRVIWNLT
jgi:long-chain acyl-CoA synthetase